MVQRWGVLGSGAVGQVLAKGLKQHGHDVRVGTREASHTRMVNPTFADGKLSMFYCGTPIPRKLMSAAIIEQFGWEPWDVGTAKAARAIEPLCQLWCISGLRENLWTHAFKVVTT